MNYFIEITMLACSMFLMGAGLILKTQTLLNSILFKVVPFFLGLALMVALFLLKGWIVIQ